MIHLEHRRIGDLHDEELLRPYIPDAAGRDAPRQRVEAVEHETERGMIDIADQRPGIAMVVDVPTPGQRLIADSQTALGCTLAGLVKIGDHPCAIAFGERRAAGADQKQIGAEFGHHVELAFQPIEGAGALWLGQTFQVAKGLEHGAGKTQVAHEFGDVARAQMSREKVILENLGAVEPGGGNGSQLRIKRAAD